MKTAVAETSIQAYHTIDRETLRGRIAEHIAGRTKHGKPSWIAQIARDLKLEKSTVSARMNELKEGVFSFDGKEYMRLEFSGKRQDPVTLITVETWSVIRAHDPGEQLNLF